MSHEQQRKSRLQRQIYIEAPPTKLPDLECELCHTMMQKVVLGAFWIFGDTVKAAVHNAPGYHCVTCDVYERGHQGDIEAFRQMIEILKQQGETTTMAHYEELVARTLVFLGSPPDTQSAGR